MVSFFLLIKKNQLCLLGEKEKYCSWKGLPHSRNDLNLQIASSLFGQHWSFGGCQALLPHSPSPFLPSAASRIPFLLIVMTGSRYWGRERAWCLPRWISKFRECPSMAFELRIPENLDFQISEQIDLSLIDYLFAVWLFVCCFDFTNLLKLSVGTKGGQIFPLLATMLLTKFLV